MSTLDYNAVVLSIDLTTNKDAYVNYEFINKIGRYPDMDTGDVLFMLDKVREFEEKAGRIPIDVVGIIGVGGKIVWECPASEIISNFYLKE